MASTKDIWYVDSTNLPNDNYPESASLDELKSLIIKTLEIAKIPVLRVNMSKRYMLIVRVQGGTAWWSFAKKESKSLKDACDEHYLRSCISK